MCEKVVGGILTPDQTELMVEESYADLTNTLKNIGVQVSNEFFQGSSGTEFYRSRN